MSSSHGGAGSAPQFRIDRTWWIFGVTKINLFFQELPEWDRSFGTLRPTHFRKLRLTDSTEKTISKNNVGHSRAQISCFAPYLRPSFSALESYTFISVELFQGTEMLGEGPQSSLPPQTSYHFLPRSSPLLIGPELDPPNIVSLCTQYVHLVQQKKEEAIASHESVVSGPPSFWRG